MKIDFLDAAQSEFDQAIDYYDDQRLGLGLEFEVEVEQALERIDHLSASLVAPITASTPLPSQSIPLQHHL